MNELEEKFNYHPPDEEKARKHNHARRAILTAAVEIDDLLPDGRERSLAMTKLEEAMFWANASIARSV